jgi:hypothetical protein
MRVEVKILPEDGEQQAGNAHVEVHHRRSEGFNIERTTTVGGDAETYVIPAGGRLVINTPLAVETPVYDHQQMASISPSQQRSTQTVLADAPEVASPEPQGMNRPTDTAPQVLPGAAQTGMPNATANQNSQVFPDSVTPVASPSSEKAAETTKAQTWKPPATPAHTPPSTAKDKDQK